MVMENISLLCHGAPLLTEKGSFWKIGPSVKSEDRIRTKGSAARTPPSTNAFPPRQFLSRLENEADASGKLVGKLIEHQKFCSGEASRYVRHGR